MSDTLLQNELLHRLQQVSESAVRGEIQSDEELLSLYLDGGCQEAIDALVRRYAPMVASVCRLTVADPASAEDAFQATFLVLLKSASKIRRRNSVAAWLHGVAYRTACRIRRKRHGHQSLQSSDEVIKPCDSTEDPIADLARKMELEALDRELERLPENLRGPLIEHYLLGYTAPEIARRMDVSLTAVEGRLKRGRRKLRTLLAKRGISLSVLLAGSALFQQHLHAGDATDWTNTFLENHVHTNGAESGTSGESAPTNPEISSLVQGEMTMISAGSVKVAASAALVLIVGTVAALAVDTSPQQNGTGNTLSIQAPSKSETVLAQAAVGFGGGAPQAGGIAPAQNAGVPGGNQQPAPGQTAPAAGGGASGFGGGNAGFGSAAEDAESLAWERPDSSGGNDPVWLAGGKASMESMDQNRAVLAHHIPFSFENEPITGIAEWLTAETETQFEVNKYELDMLGVDPDTPISISGSGSIRELLRRALGPLELTYSITESTIEITSKDAADAKPNMRFYDLAFVLPNPSNAGAVMSAIELSIDPDTWPNMGGTSSIALVGSMLIVSAPDSTHQQIEILLMNLSRMNPKNVERVSPSNTNIYPSGFGGGGFGGGMGGGGMGGGGGMF